MGVKKEEKRALKADKTEKISKFRTQKRERHKPKESRNRPWNFTGTFKPL